MKRSSPAPSFFRSSSAARPQPPRAAKERRAKRKAKTEKQASKSTHTPVSVKPEKTVTEKTTVQQTEPYCPELNRNLTPAQIDSLVALWREKQTLQSYDTFSATTSTSTASLPRVTRPPIQSMPAACGHSYHRCNSPFNPIVKTTSAVTSIPVTGQSTGCWASHATISR